jgi:predicted RNA-binding Zn-ribbon protein involved in translation (DUF1610 family)
MEQRTFHGNITPVHIAQALIAEFNQGNLRAQILGESDHLTVQIASAQGPRQGGQTALAIDIQKVTDGVTIQIGEQQWMGVAADLGATVLATLINPWNLVGRLGSVVSDIQSLQINDKVWEVIGREVQATGASLQISERLTRLECSYCGSANPVGESNCLACGAPLGALQPKACLKCGYVLTHSEKFCPNCGQAI